LLEVILQLRERKVRWRLGGASVEEGFDSPSFAAFILVEEKALAGQPGDGDLLARSRQLAANLPKAEEPLRPGDLIFFPGGYALFWFLDQNAQPFVIGMTPLGIVALEPSFAERIAARRPAYRR